ncbi:antitoxin VapB family protein [Candidatus Woesearchaeota archaeon]|nr:antitoxin VapB family protein [Candidatus Woesearchaeota archaeon]
MTSINISLRKEAYDFLKNIKTGDKSFSDVILGFKKEKSDIMRFFGALKDIDWADRQRNIGKLRESFNKRLR